MFARRSDSTTRTILHPAVEDTRFGSQAREWLRRKGQTMVNIRRRPISGAAGSLENASPTHGFPRKKRHRH